MNIVIRNENRREMLESMTDKQREVFVLYYQYGYKQEEIASLLNCALSTVNQHLKYAAVRVRKYY